MKFNFIDKKTIFSFPFLFFLLVSLNSLQVLLIPNYPTLDGPSHIYNANIIRELLFFDNQQLAKFFELNHEFIPNWTSHFILVFLSFFLPAQLANKILLLLITFSLPYAFYSVVKKISPKNIILSVFAIPFVYNYIFGLGFYNYCIAVVLFLIILKNILLLDGIRIGKGLLLLFLYTLLYFTHIFVFGMAVILLALNSLIFLIKRLKEKETVKTILWNLMIRLLLVLPGILMSFLYLNSRNFDSVSKIPAEILLKWIVNVRSLVVYSFSSERKYATLIFISVLIMVLSLLYEYFFRRSGARIRLNRAQLFLGGAVLIYFLLYMFMYNETRAGGYLSVRLHLIFYLVLLLWLSSFQYSKYILRILFLLIITASVGLSESKISNLNQYRELVKEFTESEKLITVNSVILPIKLGGKLMSQSFDNFLGWNKPVVLLRNYEANTGYFPIIWKEYKELPGMLLGNTAINYFCLPQKFPVKADTFVKVDYVVLWGRSEISDCVKELWPLVEMNYELVYSSDDSLLYLYQVKPETELETAVLF